MSEIKAGDLDLWTTETEEKVKDHLYEQIGDNVPHPVTVCMHALFCSSGKLKPERLSRTTNPRDFLLALERCISGSVRRRWRADSGKTLIFIGVFLPTNRCNQTI